MDKHVEHARQNLKNLLEGPEVAGLPVIRPIYVVRITNVRNSTASHVRYFIVTGLAIPRLGKVESGLVDVTGRVARALDLFNKYNDRTGNYLVNGGDGTETISNLSLVLFDEHNAIPALKV